MISLHRWLAQLQMGAVLAGCTEEPDGTSVQVSSAQPTTLLLVDVVETAVMATLLYSSKCLDRHISDATDVTFYWYFLVATWIPIYVIVYLSPRLM